MYRSILVPLDGSLRCEHALGAATSIAQAANAAIHVVHVHMPQYTIIPGAVPVVDTTLDHAQHEAEQAYLHGVANLLKQRDVRVSAALLEGSVAPALSEYAVKHAVDLVIMTTHGYGALARLWFGSVADQLVRTLPAPTLLLHPTSEAPFANVEVPLRHILIPLDGSKLSEQIIEHALRLGRLTDAKYTLLHVIEQLPEQWQNRLSPAGLEENTLAAAQHAAAIYLDGIAGALCERAPHMQIAVEVGQPSEVIPAYAQQHGIDLIAMATHGRGGFVRWYLGSVATRMMRTSTVPMLLYRPHDMANKDKTPAT